MLGRRASGDPDGRLRRRHMLLPAFLPDPAPPSAPTTLAAQSLCFHSAAVAMRAFQSRRCKQLEPAAGQYDCRARIIKK
jgi:hypothetical protein